MNPIPLINRTLLLAVAPFIGMICFLLIFQLSVQLPELKRYAKTEFSIQNQLQQASQQLDKAKTDAAQTRTTIERFFQLYEQSATDVANLAKTADAASSKPAAIFDTRISAKLGAKPSKQTTSSNLDMKLYYLNEPNYKAYALKVDMKSDKALKMVLGKDKIGSSETTLEAARRYGAVAGINAGGFADDNKTGRRYPLSNTIMNGKFVYGFEPTFENLAFIGLSTDRKLIGGRFSRQEDLDKLKPSFGATFVPVLLQNGKKQAIPAQWQSSPARAPRTIVGNFKNDQLLFMVTDGYDERGNSGATLAELQEKLLQLGVKDAYNLDGGGSSSLIYDGQVINHPSDGKLRPLPTHFLFFK
ncbi:phosphodiester glycosidase family protein [Paenibacillus sp. LMG 31456]|uniref:Phosphodiester glycosidase family protein n=1 Tax=Paenibacillus foliorum TaxID=2654974 RepID=A0A972JYY1_9BACL|nr:phosphodiester glycosidase family protein [Paenibacillus foliorum]NOU92170.1 phosphodiester glycosidase family protein [Paenibacillus foliorum]